MKKILKIDLLVIDLSICSRCLSTQDHLKTAIELLNPVGEILGIEIKYQEIVIKTPEEAKKHALLTSPTIRLNGRDIGGDIRESECEPCTQLTVNNTCVECREWHYRGKVYFQAPLPLLVEAIMRAMLDIDSAPVVPPPLEELPENLRRYFATKRQGCC